MLLKKNEVSHEATSFSFCTTLERLWMNSTNLEFHPPHFYNHHESAKAEGARETTSHLYDTETAILKLSAIKD